MEITGIKLFIILTLAAIATVLFSAGFFLIKRDSDPKSTMRALTLRITLSVLLILGIIVAMLTGNLNA